MTFLNIDKEYLFDLYNVLPEMVASPVSQSSLASHLQVSPPTVKNYLRRLEDFYIVFSIRPYSRNIKRSLLKAAKHYLYDWTRIKNEAKRFENYVDCELKSLISLWEDASGVAFSLFYVRNKQKQETDFLIVKADMPCLLLEAKLADGSVDRHHFETIRALGNIPFIQVCMAPNIMSLEKRNVYRASANRVFAVPKKVVI